LGGYLGGWAVGGGKWVVGGSAVWRLGGVVHGCLRWLARLASGIRSKHKPLEKIQFQSVNLINKF